MKRYFILMAVIFGMITPSVSAQSVNKKVAVYMTGNGVDESYKKVIGAKLVSAITATNEYAAVERTADFLAALSSEQDYQASGEVRDSQIARLGQRFGVRYVVVVDVSELFDELFIASRMINVETGLVEKAFESSGSAENMNQLIKISSSVADGLLGASSSSTNYLSKYNVVGGSFGFIDNAKNICQLYQNQGYSPKIYHSKEDGLYHVIISGASNIQEAIYIKDSVERNHLSAKIMYLENNQEKWIK